jgi:hypothetical protein
MQVAAGASPSRSYRSSRREYMPVAWMGEGEGEVQNVTDSSLHAHRAAAPGTRRRSLCTCYAGDRPSQRLAFSGSWAFIFDTALRGAARACFALKFVRSLNKKRRGGPVQWLALCEL